MKIDDGLVFKTSFSIHPSGMTIIIQQPQIGIEAADEKKVAADSNGLVLDGGFVVPETNTFGQTFRDYDAESERKNSVEEFYRMNHIHQTYDFVKSMREEYGKLNRVEMSIWECCELLNSFVDESDPDLDEPQIEHLLQTAEAIRKDYPNEDWLHLTGLIHDLGKYFEENPDYHNPLYNTKLGVYKEGCGLDNVLMSWGHDDYMYLVAKENKTTLPSAALFIIRYHSFYPLHRAGAYKYLMNEEDVDNLKWLQIFNKYDLYSKSKVRIDVEKVKPYYLALIDKVIAVKTKFLLIRGSLFFRKFQCFLRDCTSSLHAVLPSKAEMVRFLFHQFMGSRRFTSWVVKALSSWGN
ncbi:Inositol oxygenase 1 [Asimina triloba]